MLAYSTPLDGVLFTMTATALLIATAAITFAVYTTAIADRPPGWRTDAMIGALTLGAVAAAGAVLHLLGQMNALTADTGLTARVALLLTLCVVGAAVMVRVAFSAATEDLLPLWRRLWHLVGSSVLVVVALNVALYATAGWSA